MKLLAGGFRDNSFTSELVLKAWYEFFKDIPDKVFADNVSYWIKANNKAPTVAELLHECKRDMGRA